MTLSEGKRKVYMLLDEYSSGGVPQTDADMEAKMADFFDTAQKQAAQYKPIVRLHTVARESGVMDYAMPGDFLAPYRIWRGDRPAPGRCVWVGGKLRIPPSETETVTVEYFALPATITSATPDGYEFEVAEDAAQCLPFFVAAQQLITDLVVDSGALLGLYREALSALRRTVPGESGMGRVTNALYRA